jgi:hypothetical protein
LDVSSNPEDVQKALRISRMVDNLIDKNLEIGEIVFKNFYGYWKV